jgi:hypothetical protein
MTAVGSNNETGPEHMLVTSRVSGPHADHAIALAIDRDDARSVNDLDTSRGRRVL